MDEIFEAREPSGTDDQIGGEVLMDPKVIAELAKVSIKFVDLIARQMSENQTRFKTLIQKADENAMIPFLSGIQALGDALTTQRADTRERLLNLAETNLYSASKLDRKNTTSGKPNTFWIAQAHYALAIAFSLRQDDIMAAKHALHIMEADPSLARNELMPDLYKRLFEPECGEVLRWRDGEISRIGANAYTGEVARARLTAGGAGFLGATGVIATVALSGGRVPVAGAARSVSDQVGKMWNEATPETFRARDMNTLKVVFESRLDAECRKLAEAAIARLARSATFRAPVPRAEAIALVAPPASTPPPVASAIETTPLAQPPKRMRKVAGQSPKEDEQAPARRVRSTHITPKHRRPRSD